MTESLTARTQKVQTLTTPHKPLSLIKAGAGAGKTYHIQKTLTEWVQSGSVSADRILAVTFTNAAANELKERIRLALLQSGLHQQAAQVQQSKISTIHGFGLELIERFSYENGSSPSPRQLTEAEQNVLIRLSLTKVEQIITIIDDLSGWGYKDNFNGNEFTEAVVKFKDRVLAVIGCLRNLGSADSEVQAPLLIQNAKESVENLYGKNLFSEEILNNALWHAVQSVQDKYTFEELYAEWGSNAATRTFVKAIYRATQETVAQDWKLWTELQSIETAPKIFNKKTGAPAHEGSERAFSIWAAADQLSVHPGPLNQSLQHIVILLESSLETLGHYQLFKNQSGLVDFGDMVNLSEQLMQDDRWLDEIKSNYDCLIIDEFQDTNPLQFSLLWHIAKAGIPTLIVGDIKQSIMGFQGADSRLFNSLLMQNEANASELTYNWRSTADLMSFINKLGHRLYEERYTKLASQSDIQSSLRPVKIINFPNDSWSARGSKTKAQHSFSAEHDGIVVSEIKRILESDLCVTDKLTGQRRAVRPNDIAILGPSHAGLSSFAEELRRYGLQPQIQQSGWFESDAVTWMIYALSYLADPRDQHALMCLKLIMNQESDLQTALSNYLSQETPRKVTGQVVDALDVIRRQHKFVTITEMLWLVIDALALWDRFSHIGAGEYGQQQRANLLKLIKLGETFETTQPETLQAQGVFGAGLSSFLVWLQENSKDIDTQPHIDGDNENAVVLSTWHASKGLEWPIVVVIGMDKVRMPKLPSISVQYRKTDNVETMLDHAFAQVLTDFDDEKTKNKVIEALLPSEQETLRNLTYVVMTRAREQLILPWFDPQKDNCMISLLSREDMDNPDVVDAVVPTDITENDVLLKPIAYGRVALDYAETKPAIAGQLSPSTLASIHPVSEQTTEHVIDALSIMDYGSQIDLTVLEAGHAANDIGSWVHRIFEVMLGNPDLEERLFNQLIHITEHTELRQQLVDHVQCFQRWLKSELKAISWQSEVPILSTTDDGATLSGVIDLLLQTNDGYWIIDHKTDIDSSKDKFKKHLPQLLAYAEHAQLDKPVRGVAVHWVRNGTVYYLPID